VVLVGAAHPDPPELGPGADRRGLEHARQFRRRGHPLPETRLFLGRRPRRVEVDDDDEKLQDARDQNQGVPPEKPAGPPGVPHGERDRVPAAVACPEQPVVDEQ
jgi:hypothetical protein